MEFHEKLQQLRKQRGWTQEELAGLLYVSRTAVSKWESQRGYPSIDSLKAIAKLFSVTVDELLSGDELLSIAEENSHETQRQFCRLAFGLLDAGSVLFLFLPLFARRTEGAVRAVSLLSLTGIPVWLRAAYFLCVAGLSLWGLAALILQHRDAPPTVSLLLTAVGALAFIVSLQPYAASLLLAFLVIKIFLLLKQQ